VLINVALKPLDECREGMHKPGAVACLDATGDNLDQFQHAPIKNVD